jgi:CAAX prenyl protease-like protein
MQPVRESNRADDAPRPSAGGWRKGLLKKHRWVTFILPILVFLVIGRLEPKPPTAGSSTGWLALPYGYYPIVYTIKIFLTGAAVLFVSPGYREFRFVVNPLAFLVGVVGFFAWAGICWLDLERYLLEPLGLDWFVRHGDRSAFNPFREIETGSATLLWGFLAVRLFGLAVVIAVAEEFFLRGFLMRFVMSADWWDIPFGKVTVAAVLVGTGVPMLMHPAEFFAAGVWFTLVTWLMVKTKNIWDCVVAHGITNGLLGVYVVISGRWELI